MSPIIKDAAQSHWVYKMPEGWQPFLQLSRLDRPIGYWLLALPGWIGLAFAGLVGGLVQSDLKWAALILIGAIAMRGAGCTYNDIVDQDIDAKVERTALRPLPSGRISNKQAWIWLFAQCFIGLIVLLCLPPLAQVISLLSIPLVAAYPFMKRITWWPQLWLGMTFNWAVLVAYAAKTQMVSAPLFCLYGGLIFWTVGYDTIYACQDIEDDAFAGIKSTARRFGRHIKSGVSLCYGLCLSLIFTAIFLHIIHSGTYHGQTVSQIPLQAAIDAALVLLLFAAHLIWQIIRLEPDEPKSALHLFKSNFWAGLILTLWLLPPMFTSFF